MHNLRIQVVVLLASSLWVQSGTAIAENVRKLNGPTLARFDRPLEQLDIPQGVHFGIFRAQDPKRKQNIEESWRRDSRGKNNGSLGVLALKYSVQDGYNGLWLK